MKDLAKKEFSKGDYVSSEELEKELATKGSRLVNSYQQHNYIADITNYYEDLKISN